MSRYAVAVAQDTPINDFGLLIAYVLPGFTALWGAQPFTGGDALWQATAGSSATVAGFLFSTIAAIIAGLTVSTVRWLTLDWIHHRTGIRPAAWNFARLADRTAAFSMLLEGHYRYYQWYSNMVVALAWVFLARRATVVPWWSLGATDLGLLAAIVLFFLGSRDTLRKYYARSGELLKGTRGRS